MFRDSIGLLSMIQNSGRPVFLVSRLLLNTTIDPYGWKIIQQRNAILMQRHFRGVSGGAKTTLWIRGEWRLEPSFHHPFSLPSVVNRPCYYNLLGLGRRDFEADAVNRWK